MPENLPAINFRLFLSLARLAAGTNTNDIYDREGLHMDASEARQMARSLARLSQRFNMPQLKYIAGYFDIFSQALQSGGGWQYTDSFNEMASDGYFSVYNKREIILASREDGNLKKLSTDDIYYDDDYPPQMPPPMPPPQPPMPTTLAVGEEGGVTTLAIGEEGSASTRALYEEGGTVTTLALGEEGEPPPMPPPQPPMPVTTAPAHIEGGGDLTTQAVGEEGGVTTQAIGEEGGVTTQAIGEEGAVSTAPAHIEGGIYLAPMPAPTRNEYENGGTYVRNWST